ncbi:MAG: 4'-phosphopantetheinyl transferase superfamily protein [Evtepia sp.]|uniref:4'-phosphopantetheinyl transferase family protein n=1 Tax=Evtepia sp. TaxID=2773933 RepID=UPI002A750E9B|nr:4'-phosphopantetheinyl transferase superfamily protein [Evtepia sp.]MDY3014802.1 4'-phosphopantetheinyl transferase superfamily protein [Evtepia sp.]
MFLFAIHRLHSDILEKAAPFLTPERWRRATAFHREADRLRCVAAGLLSNFCLWKWCGERPMTLRRNRYGKPFLEGSPVQFSLSHAGDWVACGLADCPLGVDIEKVQPVEPEMYGLCLTPRERQQLEWMPMAPERRFIQLWTLKESFGKLRGDGLNCRFPRFQVEPLEGSLYHAVIRHVQTGQPCANAVTQSVEECYCLSACVLPERTLRSVVTVPVTLADMEPWMVQTKSVRWL